LNRRPQLRLLQLLQPLILPKQNLYLNIWSPIFGNDIGNIQYYSISDSMIENPSKGELA